MNLPVIAESTLPDPGSLWRLFTDLLFDHAVALGEELDSPVGRGVTAAGGCNIVLFSQEQMVSEFAENVVGMFDTVDRLVVPGDADAPSIAERFDACPFTLHRMARGSSGSEIPNGTLLLPARAAATKYEAFWGRQSQENLRITPRHLDDPHHEAFVAIRDGNVIASAALQTRGEIGLICDVGWNDPDAHDGLMLAVHRAIDLAARSQLRHVFTGAPSQETWPASVGFEPVLPFTVWRRRR